MPTKPALRGANYKQGAGKPGRKRDGLKGVHIDRWGCSDVTCNHETIDRMGTLVCAEYAAYGSNDNEGTEIRLEVFNSGEAIGWEASATISFHPHSTFKSAREAQKYIEKRVREAFAQLTREDA